MTAVRNPVEVWAKDARRVRAALDLLAQSQGSSADDIHRYALDHRADPETIHLAVSIAWEGGCRRCRDGDLCDLGRQLDREMDAGIGAYLEVVDGPEPVPPDAWLPMMSALDRFRVHRDGVGGAG